MYRIILLGITVFLTSVRTYQEHVNYSVFNRMKHISFRYSLVRWLVLILHSMRNEKCLFPLLLVLATWWPAFKKAFTAYL